MKNNILKNIIIIVFSIIIIDQLSKLLITKFVTEKIGNDKFGIEIFYNTGIAFGLNSGNNKNIVLNILVIGIVCWFLKNQIKKIDKRGSIAIGLMLGGGISNLIDRLFRNGVLDFIKISFIPNFNIADACLVIGWGLMIVSLVLYNQNIVNTEKNKK